MRDKHDQSGKREDRGRTVEEPAHRMMHLSQRDPFHTVRILPPPNLATGSAGSSSMERAGTAESNQPFSERYYVSDHVGDR